MSITIPTAYVETFSANVHMLAEQRASRLRNTVFTEGETSLESFNAERLGGVEAQQVTVLHGDTPLNNTPHTRRIGFIKDYDVADLIDRTSKVKMLIDPESKYTMRHGGAMGRAIDVEVIEALGGTANAGKTGTTLVPLPAASKIAVGGTGMTVAKVIESKERIDETDVDEFMTRYAVVTAKQISDMLDDDKITSSDFNSVKALVEGKINTWMGFEWIRSQRLKVDGSGNRLTYFYVHGSVQMEFPRNPTSEVNTRPDKRNAKQIYTDMSIGAVRVEDETVIEVACAE